jgi:hypothetical protein
MLRPFVRVPWLLLLAASFALSSPSHATAPAAEPEFRDHVASLVSEGVLGYEQGLLVRFQRTFAPNDLPSDLESPDAWPSKSATSLVLEYREMREAISRPVASILDGYLRGPRSSSALVYETERFRISYEVAGLNAVPTEDVEPANGVPDFVERIGTYAETSWNRLIEEAGFTAPRLSGSP